MRVVIKGGALLPLNAALEQIQQWIVPGALSVKFTLLQIAIERECRAIGKAVESLQTLHAEQETVDGRTINKTITHRDATTGAVVAEEIVMKNLALFNRKYAELMDTDFTVDIPALLTPANIGPDLTADMIDNTAGLVPPRGASFHPVMEGSARPAIAPAENGSRPAARSLKRA